MKKALKLLIRAGTQAPGGRTVRGLIVRLLGRRGESIRHIPSQAAVPVPGSVAVCVSENSTAHEDWIERQTLVTHIERQGVEPGEGWFFAPGDSRPVMPPSWLASAQLIAATEDIDAVVLAEGPSEAPETEPEDFLSVLEAPWRGLTLFSARTFTWNSADDRIQLHAREAVVKIIPPGGIGDRTDGRSGNRRRRGPYLGSRPLPDPLEIPVRSHFSLELKADGSPGPGVLVTAPFLARGGAEHTLFETFSALRGRCRPAFVTLAPHRPELGDRRKDFARLSPHLFSLGDWVHPDAMPAMLVALIDALAIEVLYNANGTTLFYDFAPLLKSARPNLRIVDHLYDHRVGYVEKYRDPTLLDTIDVCIAENTPIRKRLVEEFAWPEDRVPVCLPCARSADDLPPEERRADIRRRLRSSLGCADDEIVFLTAARMNAQKRPLDLIRLAERVKDLEKVRFLVVGGGPLETEVDRAVKASGASIARLPFREDIPELIIAADVGLLVSEFEGLPVFMLECLQLGRPFLGTDVGDLGRVLRKAEAGIVVDEPGDLNGLETAVRLLADEDFRDKAAARTAGAIAAFRPEVCAERYAAALLGGF